MFSSFCFCSKITTTCLVPSAVVVMSAEGWTNSLSTTHCGNPCAPNTGCSLSEYFSCSDTMKPTLLSQADLCACVCAPVCSADRLQSGVSWYCLFKQYYKDLGRYIQYYPVLKKAWDQLKSFLQQRCPRMIASLKGEHLTGRQRILLQNALPHHQISWCVWERGSSFILPQREQQRWSLMTLKLRFAADFQTTTAAHTAFTTGRSWWSQGQCLSV